MTVLENTVFTKTLQENKTSSGGETSSPLPSPPTSLGDARLSSAGCSGGETSSSQPKVPLKRPLKTSALPKPTVSPNVIVHGEPTEKSRFGRKLKAITNLEEFLGNNETLLESCKSLDIKRNPKKIQECKLKHLCSCKS